MNFLIEYAGSTTDCNSRLSCDWIWIGLVNKKTKQADAFTSINPDAHSIEVC